MADLKTTIRDACQKNGTDFLMLDFESTGMMVEFKGRIPDGLQEGGRTGKTLGKTLGKTPELILERLKKMPTQTIPNLAKEISKSESAVQRAILKLQADGCLRRVGGRKEGRWDVLDKKDLK